MASLILLIFLLFASCGKYFTKSWNFLSAIFISCCSEITSASHVFNYMRVSYPYRTIGKVTAESQQLQIVLNALVKHL